MLIRSNLLLSIVMSGSSIAAVVINLFLSQMQSSGEDGSLVVDYFTFSPSIADYMKSASLVISHAGILPDPRLKLYKLY